VLQESSDNKKMVAVEKLQPSAQMLLFSFIYGKNVPLYLNTMPEKLGFSAMTISRAADQLVATGLVEAYKDGVNRVLTSQLAPQELFEQAQLYLINPIRKTMYVDKAFVQKDFFLSGLSALAETTMLNPPEIPVYGTTKELALMVSFIDDGKCAVEIWRYDPTILSGGKAVDPLSLAVQLAKNYDERVQLAAEELLKKVWN